MEQDSMEHLGVGLFSVSVDPWRLMWGVHVNSFFLSHTFTLSDFLVTRKINMIVFTC